MIKDELQTLEALKYAASMGYDLRGMKFGLFTIKESLAQPALGASSKIKMKRPAESDYSSHVAYTRALEEYCDRLEAVRPKREPTDIAALVEGMEVSIDVSTGDHDSGHRLFGTVTRAQESQGSKHGLILLVQDPEPNFIDNPNKQKEKV